MDVTNLTENNIIELERRKWLMTKRIPATVTIREIIQ